MLNRIIIHGRITADPELKQTQSGVSVCNFTVAVDRSYTRGEDKQTDFFNCVAWRGLADTISKFFPKGKEIVLSGEMQSRRWEDDQGNKRLLWELIADGFDFCGNKESKINSTNNETASSDITETINDDDIPF